MSKRKTKQNGVYCVCANLIIPGYQAKNAFHLDKIITNEQYSPKSNPNHVRFLACTFTSLFYVSKANFSKPRQRLF